MTAGLGAVVRSPAVRAVFVSLVLVGGAVAVARSGQEARQALASLPVGTMAAAAAVGVLYMLVTMLVWRAVLHDMGSRLALGASTRLFFASQLGKYLPGGVWNIVAATEMGVDLGVPRRRSLSVMLVSTLISVTTGLGLAAAALPLAPDGLGEKVGWLLWLLPLFALALAPPVLNRLLDRGLRLLRRAPLEHALTTRGVLTAAFWSVLAWGLVGVHVWLLAVGVGLDRSPTALALAIGSYALAWTAGFLVLLVPAGLGVREAVLAAALASQLDAGAVVVVVLLSRAVLTVVDFLMGVAALMSVRRA